jgi:hypothetical protein
MSLRLITTVGYHIKWLLDIAYLPHVIASDIAVAFREVF